MKNTTTADKAKQSTTLENAINQAIATAESDNAIATADKMQKDVDDGKRTLVITKDANGTTYNAYIPVNRVDMVITKFNDKQVKIDGYTLVYDNDNNDFVAKKLSKVVDIVNGKIVKIPSEFAYNENKITIDASKSNDGDMLIKFNYDIYKSTYTAILSEFASKSALITKLSCMLASANLSHLHNIGILTEYADNFTKNASGGNISLNRQIATLKNDIARLENDLRMLNSQKIRRVALGLATATIQQDIEYTENQITEKQSALNNLQV